MCCPLGYFVNCRSLRGSAPPRDSHGAFTFPNVGLALIMGESQDPRGSKKVVLQPYLHELCAGAHMLPETEKKVLLGGQDLCQLRKGQRVKEM